MKISLLPRSIRRNNRKNTVMYVEAVFSLRISRYIVSLLIAAFYSFKFTVSSAQKTTIMDLTYLS